MSKEPMTDKQIKDLAKRIYKGEVFTSYTKGMTTHLLPMVFMPLVFLSDETKQEMIDNEADMLYAPLSAAGPRSINGMPQFYEFNWCSKTDTEKVFEKLEAIREAVKEATE